MPKSLIGAAVGGIINKKSGDKAVKASTEAADKAADIQKYMYDTTRADLAPLRKTGDAANKRLSYLMGLGDVAFDKDALRNHIISQSPTLFKLVGQPQQQQQAQGGAVVAPATMAPMVNTGGVTTIPEQGWDEAIGARIPVFRGGGIHPSNLSRYLQVIQPGGA